MAQGDTSISFIGNVVETPELRFTKGEDVPVTNIRVASTPRFYDKKLGDYKDGEPLFLSVNIWRDMAEHVVHTIEKGMRVIIVGRLRQTSYTTPDGDRRTSHEIEADEVGVSLRNATAEVIKVTRNSRQSTPSVGASPTKPFDPF